LLALKDKTNKDVVMSSYVISKVFIFVLLFSTHVFSAELEENSVESKFSTAVGAYQSGDLSKSRALIQELLPQNHALQKYILYYHILILEKEIAKLSLDAIDRQTKNKELFQSIEQLLKFSLNEKMKRDVLVSYSRMDLNPKELKKILSQMKQIEKRTRNLEIYPSAVFSLAIVSLKANQPAQACRWIKKLYSQYPLSKDVEGWGARLSENEFLGKKITFCKESEKDLRQRVRILALLGREDQAFKEIEGYYKSKKEELNFEKNKTLAVVYRQKEDIFKAIELLEVFFKEHKNNSEYLLQLANLYAKTDNVEKASSLFQMVYKKEVHSKFSQQALFGEALLNYQSENYDGANRNFKEFIKKYGKIKQARDARWFLGWLSYLRGDFQGAEQDFSILLKSREYKKIKFLSKEKIEYWLAMSYLRQGQVDKAQIEFEKLASVTYFGFYNLAAQARLKQMNVKKRKVETTVGKEENVEGEVQAQAQDETLNQDTEEESFNAEESSSEETSVADKEGAGEEVEKVGSEAESVEKEELFPGLQKTKFVEQFQLGLKLVEMGLTDWAKLEFFEIEKKTKNKEFLRTLMLQYQNIGEYYRPFYLSQITFARPRTQGGIDGARYLWEFAYPKAFEVDVKENSKKTNVTTEFIWSIMRAESNYRSSAVSPAGALGLMQIMPFTGQKVSEMLGLKNYNPMDLLVPEVNIRLGTRYLQRLLNQFNDSTILASAAYNGGPHRVHNWLLKFGNIDADEFIEHIPYLETRNYVKKVLTNEYLYKTLYASKSTNLEYLAHPIRQNKVEVGVANHPSAEGIQFKEKWD